jgi:dTDP-4-dehydrorhamnose reductase
MDGRILITGGGGLLARSLARLLQAAELLAPPRCDLDITDRAAIDRVLASWEPRTVINCAAMTAVDTCESRAADAHAANAKGPANLANLCGGRGIRLIHFSTDYVFAGDLDRPYHEQDIPAPRTVYGQSKLAGEEAVRAHCPDHLISRIAWLYGPGGPSFLHTMLRLGREAGPALAVVDDQIGNPTSTDAVAAALLPLLDHPLRGTVHLTCEGEVTWYGFAQAIFARCGLTRGLRPCTTAEYPRPAPRPANSRLDKRALRQARLPAMPTWQESLDRFLSEFPHG